MNRRETLEAAIEIVCENRQDSYGNAEDNFKLIADLWGVYLDYKITPTDVANMMILLKIARAKTGKFKEDNYIDIAGYAACGCEIGFNKNE